MYFSLLFLLANNLFFFLLASIHPLLWFSSLSVAFTQSPFLRDHAESFPADY